MMTTRKVLVTGASGLLGREVMKAFAGCEGFDAVGVARSRAGNGLARLDLLDRAALDAAVDSIAPDIVVHCAAERRPDVGARDPDAMRRLNVDATGWLAAATARSGGWMILVSTDYVFDGVNPPFAEDAPANPINDYGRSKRDAELAMLAESPDGAVLRVPILYGPTDDLEESAVTAGVARALLDPKTARRECDDWAVRHPTCTTDVAAAILALARRRASAGDISGTYHFSSPERMTKYTMAIALAEFFGRDPSILAPLSEPVPGAAPRPRDSTLSCGRIEALGIRATTTFRAGIARSLPRHSPGSPATSTHPNQGTIRK